MDHLLFTRVLSSRRLAVLNQLKLTSIFLPDPFQLPQLGKNLCQHPTPPGGISTSLLTQQSIRPPSGIPTGSVTQQSIRAPGGISITPQSARAPGRIPTGPVTQQSIRAPGGIPTGSVTQQSIRAPGGISTGLITQQSTRPPGEIPTGLVTQQSTRVSPSATLMSPGLVQSHVQSQQQHHVPTLTSPGPVQNLVRPQLQSTKLPVTSSNLGTQQSANSSIVTSGPPSLPGYQQHSALKTAGPPLFSSTPHSEYNTKQTPLPPQSQQPCPPQGPGNPSIPPNTRSGLGIESQSRPYGLTTVTKTGGTTGYVAGISAASNVSGSGGGGVSGPSVSAISGVPSSQHHSPPTPLSQHVPFASHKQGFPSPLQHQSPSTTEVCRSQ